MDDRSATPSTRTTDRSRAIGVMLVFVATIAWSLSGLFTRMLTTDLWTALVWRSFFGGLFLGLAQLMIDRGRFWDGFVRLGLPGWLLAAALVVCQACTVGAFYLTSVADVALIYATAPFLAAALAWWVLGERLPARTIVASLVTLLGTSLVLMGSVGRGHLSGDLLALGMTLSFAVVIVIPRAKPHLPIRSATIVGAVLTTAAFAPLSTPTAASARDWTVLAVFGFTNFVVALFVFIAGARRIPSTDAALIGTLELVLSPIWVWLAFGEEPGMPAIVGGAIIAVAVIGHTVADARAPISKNALEAA